MKTTRLGRTDITVSRICLGTMTWGEQNTQDDAFQQMDYAIDNGVNFFDTAELYAVPPRPETQGRTETKLGNWFKARGTRDKVVLATKVAGPSHAGPAVAHFRDGAPRLDRKNIEAALDASLKRLQTDYVDLYQLHWPDRPTNNFGRLGYEHDTDFDPVPLEETLSALGDLVKAGKIRAVGVSNETPWGVMKMLEIANRTGLPRIASVQNPYALTNRTYDVGLAEVSLREDCGLLAYSPLGFGSLSGKYIGGARPEGARLTMFPVLGRYNSPLCDRATERYVELARDHGLDPAQMALAFVNTRPFVTSTIIGATTMAQLESNIASWDMTLSSEILEAIETIHTETPNPAP